MRLVKKSAIARVLDFQQEGEEREISEGVFLATPMTVKKKRARRGKTPVVQLATRCFTHSCLNVDGYRPKPICVDQPRPKKRPRAKLILVQQDEQADDEPMEEQGKNVQEEIIVKPIEEKGSEFEEMEFPPTPIHVMQSVGIRLGIDPSKITREQLEANPSVSESNSSDD
jgi:hypothetical protein